MKLENIVKKMLEVGFQGYAAIPAKNHCDFLIFVLSRNQNRKRKICIIKCNHKELAMKEKTNCNNSIIVLISLLTFLFFVSACNPGRLSRANVKKKLEERLNRSIYTDLASGFVAASYNLSMMDSSTFRIAKNPSPQMYQELRRKGLVNLTPLGRGILQEKYYVSFPDEVAKKYIVSTRKGGTIKIGKNSYSQDSSSILLGDLKVGKITGITEPSDIVGQKVSYIEFELIVDKTPFGETMLSNYLQQSPVPFKAEFILYDDGWRLTNKVLPTVLW